MTRTRALLISVALILGGCSSSSPGPIGVLPVCLVTTTLGVNDHGFNHLAAIGVQSAGARLRVIQSHSAADYLPNLENCASAKPDITIAVSAGMANAVWHVATELPAQRFVLVDAEPLDDAQQVHSLGNVEALLFKQQEAGYVVGALAGLMEKGKIGAAGRNVAGILGTNHQHAIDAYVAGFVAGARSVDPAIQFQLTYSDSDDVFVCKEIGRGQVVKGSDVLFEVTGRCAAGYIDAAYDASAYAIGSDNDLAYLSPAVITSALKKVDRVVGTVINDLRAGTFKAGRQVFGLQEDAVGFSTPSSVVPQGIINQVLDIKAKIRSGAIVPPETIPPGV